MKNIIPVILAGGSGTRLWPLSRENYPKQFLRLVDDNSLMQNTYLRTCAIGTQTPVIVCNQNHYFLCQDQLREIGLAQAHYILEPEGRNTAAAIAMAALLAEKNGQADAVLAVFPADHVIASDPCFEEKISEACQLAEQDCLITFGIVPTAPKTGYGYIEAGKQTQPNVYQVKQFVEKPDLATAEKYLNASHFYWNSGMFVFKASFYLQELKRHAPDIYQACQNTFAQSQFHQDYIRLDADKFAKIRSESIDYAVMEKTRNALVLPLAIAWSDLGCWSSVAEAETCDADNNITKGKVLLKNSHNSFVASADKLVCAIGLDDHIVVNTDDAVLIAHKQYTQDVKALVTELKTQHPELATDHRRVYRPWGFYESLSVGKNYQVKHIMVKPGAKLSLQLHYHRAEHWIVVAGTADVVRGEDSFQLSENQSTYIPVETKHRLSNSTDTPLHLIEVQTGDYLGEDDIVRFQDDYGRAVGN